MEASSKKPSEIKIRDIFPTLTEHELKEAEENFRRYLELALQMFTEQFSVSGQSHVDNLEPSLTIKERSNTSLKS